MLVTLGVQDEQSQLSAELKMAKTKRGMEKTQMVRMQGAGDISEQYDNDATTKIISSHEIITN